MDDVAGTDGGGGVDFSDTEKALAWLDKQSVEVRSAISSRAVLRVCANICQIEGKNSPRLHFAYLGQRSHQRFATLGEPLMWFGCVPPPALPPSSPTSPSLNSATMPPMPPPLPPPPTPPTSPLTPPPASPPHPQIRRLERLQTTRPRCGEILRSRTLSRKTTVFS